MTAASGKAEGGDARDADCEYVRQMFKRITGVDVEVRTVNGRFFVTDPDGQEFDTGLARKQ